MAKRTKSTTREGASSASKDARSPEPRPNAVVEFAVDRRQSWIDSMRPFRGRHERDVSIDNALLAIERTLRERHETLGDVIDVWNQHAPPVVRDITGIAGLAQGTLTLTANSSSASYELSRVLRNGLERLLLDRFPSRVRRIKVRIGTSGG